jgi:hypothetical protein
MARYTGLVGELLAETGYLAGGLFVADLAVAFDFIDVVHMIKDHHAVFRGKFHAVLDIGGKGKARERYKGNDDDQKFFH